MDKELVSIDYEKEYKILCRENAKLKEQKEALIEAIRIITLPQGDK